MPSAPERLRISAVDELADRVRAVPGISSVSAAPAPLVQGSSDTRVALHVGDLVLDTSSGVDVVYATPDYFTTLRQPILAGRNFDGRDEEGAGFSAIVTAGTARLLWGEREALGRRLSIPRGNRLEAEYTVVGIAQDVKLHDLAETSRPVIYVARAQHAENLFGRQIGSGVAFLTVRVADGFAPNGPALARTISALGIRVQSATALEVAVGTLVMPQRIGRALLGLLGTLAVTLTLVGVYGLVSYILARSRKELGIRIALGAGAREILVVLLSRAFWPVAAGLLAGATLGWLTGGMADRFMYGMDGSDPATVFLTVAAVLSVTIVATIVPARRALRTDPIATLRSE